MKFLLIIALVFGVSFNAKSSIIEIHGQEEFNSLAINLNKIIASNDDYVVIKIFPGTYYYSQSMISLSVQNDNLSLSFIGKDVTFVPVHSMVKTYNPSYVQFQGEDVMNLWSEVVQSSELISVVDEAKKLCRIRIAGGIIANTGDQ